MLRDSASIGKNIPIIMAIRNIILLSPVNLMAVSYTHLRVTFDATKIENLNVNETEPFVCYIKA